MPLRKIARDLSRGALLPQDVMHCAAVSELLRARRHGWPAPPPKKPKLAPLKEVTAWMANPEIIDQRIGVFERTNLWMNLRLLHGLDLPEFLQGSRHAYSVVHDLLRAADFDALEPLMQPKCLETLEGFAPNIAAMPRNTDDSITMLSAVLSAAHLLEPCSYTPEGTAHLEVKFQALQGVTLHDFRSGATPLALPRLQQSTWTFEGTVRPEGEQRGGADESDAWDEWQVVDVEWQVWEVQEPANARKTAQEQFPTHGGSA
jgi:hypothetical protein